MSATLIFRANPETLGGDRHLLHVRTIIAKLRRGCKVTSKKTKEGKAGTSLRQEKKRYHNKLAGLKLNYGAIIRAKSMNTPNPDQAYPSKNDTKGIWIRNPNR
jgi:hypothetical protein